MSEGIGSHPAPSHEFRAFLERDWQQWLKEVPELASAVGAPGSNDRWTDDSPPGVAERRHHLAESLTKLDRFERNPLPPTDQLSYDLYRELLVSSEEGLAFGNDPFPFRLGSPHNLRLPVNPMEGIQLSAADTVDIQPLVTTHDYEDLLARFDAYPVAVQNNIDLLVAGLKLGFSPPRITLVGVPGQISSQLTTDPLASAPLKPFREYPATVPESDRERLTSRAVQLYRDRLAPSLTRLREYLDSVYLPGARETIGASALPNGAEYYAFLVRWQTTTDLTPKQIHEIGLAEVRRLRAEMDALIQKVGFAGTYGEFCEFLRTDPQFFYDTPEELLSGYRVIAKKIDPALSRLFGRLPRLPYGVVEMPEYRAPSSPAAFYMPGAPTTGRAGYFYANTFKVGVRPKWEMEALTLHEAVPGHHLQISLAQEPQELPEFRRQTGFTAYIEGWGLYAESLGEELGLYRDPYSKFGQLTYDMWRSVRLVVDTGMHSLGWTRDQAIRFFRENSGKSDQDIQVEIDRYIVWPGQALAYKIGQLKIRELRTIAERRLGDRFDVRAFHDVVLEQGSLPLSLLTERIDRWIEERGAG